MPRCALILVAVVFAQALGSIVATDPYEIAFDSRDSLQVSAQVLDAKGVAQGVRLRYLSRGYQKLFASSMGIGGEPGAVDVCDLQDHTLRRYR